MFHLAESRLDSHANLPSQSRLIGSNRRASVLTHRSSGCSHLASNVDAMQADGAQDEVMPQDRFAALPLRTQLALKRAGCTSLRQAREAVKRGTVRPDGTLGPHAYRALCQVLRVVLSDREP